MKLAIANFAPARDLYVQFCIQYFLKIFIDKFQIL